MDGVEDMEREGDEMQMLEMGCCFFRYISWIIIVFSLASNFLNTPIDTGKLYNSMQFEHVDLWS